MTRTPRLVAGTAVAGVLLVVVLGGAAIAADHSSDWILVRLAQPLQRLDTDGEPVLVTGRTRLDRAIAAGGVHRIDSAVTVSAGQVRREQALSRRGLDRLYRFHLSPGTDVAAAVARFAGLPGVEYAQPDYLHFTQGKLTPNDEFFDQQWGYSQLSDADVDGPEAWAVTTGSSEVVIAVLDTGVNTGHPDLSGKVDEGYDFVNDDPIPNDDFDHGTRVASVASAKTDNFAGIAGSCWNCRLMAAKVLDENGDGMSSWLVSGVVWATDNGADVIVYSAGNNTFSQAVLDAVHYARDAGVVVVPAAGNQGVVIPFPARFAETVAASASDQQDRRATFSSTGREIDQVSPGVSIAAATADGGYVLTNGTSFSAPLVAGLVGLIRSLQPNVGRDEARDLINFGSEDEVGLATEDTPGWDPFHGWGRVNMEQTVLGAQAVATMRVDGGETTRLFYEISNPVATSYDFVRGNLENLALGLADIELGEVLCIEDDSVDPDTSGNEDSENPLPGRGFFYVGRFNSGPWPGSFGGSSDGVDRVAHVETGSADLTVDGGVGDGELGESVAAAGDVNNDGFDDVIVGAWRGATPLGGHGSAYLHLGSASGLEPAPSWVVHSDQDKSRLGQSVAGAGDVNNDGFDDLIVGERLWGGAVAGNQGRALVYYGSATGPPSAPSVILEDPVGGIWFGDSVSSAGDVDNDGFDDVVVGASRYTNGESQEGRAYVYMGSASGLSTTPDWTFESDQERARLTAVSTAGDVNDDGFDDVIVAAPLYDVGRPDQGRVWVFLGSSSGLSDTPATTLDGLGDSAEFGRSVRAAGDLDEDQKDDVIVGALRYSNGELEEGGVFIHTGTASGVSSSPSWTFETDQHWALISDASAIGDVDNDGHTDVMVGSNGYRVSRRDEGRAWLFSGTDGGPESASSWTEIGRQVDARFGTQATAAGDVNNDGYDDVVIAADGFETTSYNQGRLYVYYGSASGLAPPDTTLACDAVP